MTLNELKFTLRVIAASPKELHEWNLSKLDTGGLIKLPVAFFERPLLYPHQAVVSEKWIGSHVLPDQTIHLDNLDLYRYTEEETTATVMENYLRSGRYSWSSDSTDRDLYVDLTNRAIVVHEREEEYVRFGNSFKCNREFYFTYGSGSLDVLLNDPDKRIEKRLEALRRSAMDEAFDYSENLRKDTYCNQLYRNLSDRHLSPEK